MRFNVKWIGRNGEPGMGVLTSSAFDLPPTADKEIPVVMDRHGRMLTARDLEGVPLRRVGHVPDELALRACEVGFTFV